MEEKDAMTKDQDNTRDRSESQKKGEEKKKQRLFFINLKKKNFLTVVSMEMEVLG